MTRAATALALLVSGCAPFARVDEEALRQANPRTLAVLPFELDSQDAGPRGALQAAALRAAVQHRIAALPWLHLELEEVDRLLARAGLSPERAAAASYQTLARVLGVDALLRGRVTKLSNLQGGVVFRQAIGAELRLVDARTGVELAQVRHTEAKTGGLLLDRGQSVEAVQQTLDNTSDIGFVRLAERFAEEVVAVLPPPPSPARVEPPALERVEARATGATPLGVAAEVEVQADGPPGLTGAFDLGHGIAEVPLVEEAPGRYRGWYRVATGDRADEPPSVHLGDRWGVGVQRVLRDTPVPIEARPPRAPQGLALAPAPDGGARLTWSGCPEAVCYRVFALDARGIPRLLGVVEAPGLDVPPGAGPRLAVAALDAQGDLSDLALVDAPGGAP